MTFRDFMLLSAVCFVWGANLVVSRWTIADAGLPPFFFAGIRFLGVAIILFWMLRPVPRNIGMLFLISLGIGSLHFAFLFVGLKTAEAGAAAIVAQLGVPISTLMSMAFLSEKVGWRRGLGIAMAFIGAAIITVNPDTFTISIGLIYVTASAFVASGAGILMKKMPGINPLQLQAWIGLFSFAPLLILSGFTETGSIDALLQGGVAVWAALAFAVIAVSIFGHSTFYSLLRRYDVSLISPLLVMTPIWGVLLSVVFLKEALTFNLIVGAAISLIGVFVILIRQNESMPEAALGDKVRGPIK